MNPYAWRMPCYFILNKLSGACALRNESCQQGNCDFIYTSPTMVGLR